MSNHLDSPSPAVEDRCSCKPCPFCKGLGTVYFDNRGRYVGPHRIDDFCDPEVCDQCYGGGAEELCDLCATARDEAFGADDADDWAATPSHPMLQ